MNKFDVIMLLHRMHRDLTDQADDLLSKLRVEMEPLCVGCRRKAECWSDRFDKFCVVDLDTNGHAVCANKRSISLNNVQESPLSSR